MKIKELQKKKGISTYDLSYESVISRNQINSIEKGNINTSICTLKSLADAMGLKVKDLIDF
ncbi:helix-turn-helix domain-containing protein [Muricauda ruestringensis]|nr:helix-turn-helix domain-containing protein [Allomuricauda ruestringensis]